MKYLLGATLLIFSSVSQASWIEASGKVTSLMTYSSTETVLVTLTSEGSPVEQCSNTTTFAISKSASEESRSRMFAMLLTAKTAGTTVAVAFNSSGGCEPWGANPEAYRIIKRLR